MKTSIYNISSVYNGPLHLPIIDSILSDNTYPPVQLGSIVGRFGLIGHKLGVCVYPSIVSVEHEPFILITVGGGLKSVTEFFISVYLAKISIA